MGKNVERREEEMEERTEGHRKGGWEEGGRGTKPQRSPSPGSGVHRAGESFPSPIPSITPSPNHP